MKRKLFAGLALLLSLCFLVSCGGASAEKEIVSSDVQQLWQDAGFSYGYPQACLVVKSSLLNEAPETVQAFVSAVKESVSFAENNPEKAVQAIAAHMEKGAAPSVTELSAETVKRSNIVALDAVAVKKEVQDYLNLFLALESETDTPLIGGKLPDENFYAQAGEGKGSLPALRVYMPDGATALALSGLMHEKKDVGGAKVTYTVVAPSNITKPLISNDVNEQADFAIVPTNIAAKLYNANGKYKMLMENTSGNLYILGEETGLDALKGKRVGTIGRGAVPELVLRYLLKNAEIEYVFSDTAATGKVAISYLTDGSAVIKSLKAGLIDFGLLAEPAASKALKTLNA